MCPFTIYWQIFYKSLLFFLFRPNSTSPLFLYASLPLSCMTGYSSKGASEDRAVSVDMGDTAALAGMAVPADTAALVDTSASADTVVPADMADTAASVDMADMADTVVPADMVDMVGTVVPENTAVLANIRYTEDTRIYMADKDTFRPPDLNYYYYCYCCYYYLKYYY